MSSRLISSSKIAGPILLSPPELLANVPRPTKERNVLLMLDKDGTLDPKQVDPTRCFVPRETCNSIASLADHPYVQAPIVSGRTVRELDLFLGQDVAQRTTRYGLHGVEKARPGATTLERGVSAQAAVQVEEIFGRVSSSLNSKGVILARTVEDAIRMDGVYCEVKNGSLTVHFRSCPHHASLLREELTNIKPTLPAGFSLHTGDCIYEIRIAGNKGIPAQEEISANRGAFFVCIGDDITDLDMMRVVAENLRPGQYANVLVGDTLLTQVNDWTKYGNPFNLRSPEEVGEFLALAANEWMTLGN